MASYRDMNGGNHTISKFLPWEDFWQDCQSGEWVVPTCRECAGEDDRWPMFKTTKCFVCNKYVMCWIAPRLCTRRCIDCMPEKFRARYVMYGTSMKNCFECGKRRQCCRLPFGAREEIKFVVLEFHTGEKSPRVRELPPVLTAPDPPVLRLQNMTISTKDEQTGQ